MKVLHVLASNKYSGAENVVCQIIKMFEGEIEMAYCSPDGPIRDALSERNISFLPITKLNKRELKKVIQQYQPDIIHAHDMRASFIVSHSNGKTPFISHIHNNAFDSRGISLKSIAYLFTGLKAKHIFWVSESAYKGYKFGCFLNKKSSILYNVVDIEELYKKMREDNKEYDYDIIYLGRLTYPKNPQRLIKVLAAVIKRKPETKIAVVGTGELEKETKQLAKALKIDKNIDFLGFTSNPLKILHDSKVMVMTSRWEGTPMCALEAMALGVPIVSTPVDGLKKLIKNGKNGFLCDLDNDLVDKILLIVNDKNLRLVFRNETEKRAIKFNCIEEYKKKLIKYYEENKYNRSDL